MHKALYQLGCQNRSWSELLGLFSATKGGRCCFAHAPDALSAVLGCPSASWSSTATPITPEKPLKTFRSTCKVWWLVFFFFKKKPLFPFPHSKKKKKKVLKCYFSKRLNIPLPPPTPSCVCSAMPRFGYNQVSISDSISARCGPGLTQPELPLDGASLAKPPQALPLLVWDLLWAKAESPGAVKTQQQGGRNF